MKLILEEGKFDEFLMHSLTTRWHSFLLRVISSRILLGSIWEPYGLNNVSQTGFLTVINTCLDFFG